jgi:hypothetical protein
MRREGGGSLAISGRGGERTRTADFYVANVALYQLSYTPEESGQRTKGRGHQNRRKTSPFATTGSLRSAGGALRRFDGAL